MSQCDSELSQLTNLTVQIENCLLDGLKSVQLHLDQDTIENIRHKIEDISNNKSIVQSIEYFLFVLINNIDHLKKSININVDKEDYENLQNTVQKAQAEIRKHIRLEQQLKIYMDGLEEKVDQLQKQLQTQSHKYFKLYESAKMMDGQMKQLKKKLKAYEMKMKISQQKQVKTLSHKNSKILSQPSMYQSQANAYKLYNEKARVTRARNFADRSMDHKILHISQGGEHKSQINKKGLEGNIDVSLGHSRKHESEKPQIKGKSILSTEMTKTIQLKQNAKKHSRKLLKYTTEQKSLLSKKDARSNSVCN